VRTAGLPEINQPMTISYWFRLKYKLPSMQAAISLSNTVLSQAELLAVMNTPIASMESALPLSTEPLLPQLIADVTTKIVHNPVMALQLDQSTYNRGDTVPEIRSGRYPPPVPIPIPLSESP
jgi:hypothetical protein